MSKRAILSAMLGVLLFGAMASAQNITATITGTITDSSGAVVPKATVTIHSKDTNSDVRTVQSDSTGVYVAELLPFGNYTVTVKADGFQDWTASDVVLHVGDRLGLDAQLQPGQVTQTVTVTASTTPVQTASAAQSGTITGEQIRELADQVGGAAGLHHQLADKLRPLLAADRLPMAKLAARVG